MRDVENARLSLLGELLLGRFEELLGEFGVGLHYSSRMFWGSCPVHGGDNPGAFNLFTGGDVPGVWVCYTHQCERTFKRTPLGFVRGMLSSQKKGWRSPGDGVVPFGEAVDFSCSFLGVPWRDVRVGAEEVRRSRFRGLVAGWGVPSGPAVRSAPSREDIRRRLVVPSPYFLSRGYPPDILDRFDVGDCLSPGKVFTGRAVVPVYAGKQAVGFLGRSFHAECGSCGLHHPPTPPCPFSPQEKARAAKWYNDLPAAHHLYNPEGLGPARGGDLLIVEGPGCLWRVVEAGFENVVATFGARLTGPQQVLVESAGPRRVLVGYDDDEAGERGFAEVARMLGRLCRVVRVRPPAHDFGACAAGEVRAFLGGVSWGP